MFMRVRDFGVEHAADFAPTSLGTQLFTKLGTVVDELGIHSASQSSSSGTEKEGTVTRSQARRALRDDMEAISRTSRAMAVEIPGLSNKFRVPHVENDQNLLTTARGFATDVTPYVDNFVAHELPAGFVDKLNESIGELEAAMGMQSSGRGHRAAAIAAIDDSIDDGLTTVKKLDVIVKNKYSNNSAVLAQWTSASHIERDPHHHKTSTPQPTQPPAPGGAPPAP